MTKQLATKFTSAASILAQNRMAAGIRFINPSVTLDEDAWILGPDLKLLSNESKVNYQLIMVSQRISVLATKAEVPDPMGLSYDETKELVKKQSEKGCVVAVKAYIEGGVEYSVRARSERGDGDALFWDRKPTLEIMLHSEHSSRWQYGKGLTSSLRVTDIDDLIRAEREVAESKELLQ
ncbi:hypothetical protein BCR33DRAFT_720166 [Rhizoclosmatium globosum]|uniref:Uncharacterized protein n=1 Tax=Rhizoclosmatium globosum TaxID=329046 RepID=A0A1Y2BX56_9FUNG|nr:hypothetical protein BCR33DRAFT_720166 [Rhizoclosmatium globosum]|eukprot:ORY39333.1 hypothetical protein BCR33DRAFT_720166 [Rhizoclosmatium globosum]